MILEIGIYRIYGSGSLIQTFRKIGKKGQLEDLVGFKIFDWITPFSLNKEIEEKNNTAAGVIVAGIMIALGLIVAAAIL